MIPNREDIFNILTHCYKNNKLDSDLFSTIFRKHFPLNPGDTVNTYMENISIGKFEVLVELTVVYFNIRNITNYIFKFKPNELEDQNG